VRVRRAAPARTRDPVRRGAAHRDDGGRDPHRAVGERRWDREPGRAARVRVRRAARLARDGRTGSDLARPRHRPPRGPACGRARAPARARVRTPMADTQYDVIIIGTGAGGGTLAYRLAPTGKRILLLERGGYVPREKENWDSRAVEVESRY